MEATESIDMKHSSRAVWSTLNKLAGWKKIFTKSNSVSANSIASYLLSNGKYTNPKKLFTYSVNQKLKEAWNPPSGLYFGVYDRRISCCHEDL